MEMCVWERGRKCEQRVTLKKKKQHSVQKHSTIQTQLHGMVLILLLTCVTSAQWKSGIVCLHQLGS